MALSAKHLSDVCFIWGGSKTCRYVDEDQDDKGKTVHVCKKLSPSSQIIDEEVHQFMQDCAKSGQDPHSQGQALGNNCQGYLKLSNKPQGYDVKE